MGNPLLKKYNIEKETHFIGGYNNYWKIYKGIHKERKKEVSIFVFEKKKIDKLKRDQREEIINNLKKECHKLIKYKHPNILGVIEPVLEDKETLVFVTEPINNTLNCWIETVKPSKLEIKTLFIELINTISFLHQDAKVIHLSICPENIYIDNQSHLKLSGFNFSLTDTQKYVSELKLYNYNISALPNLSYCAPEIIYDCKVGYFSDIFSLGVLIHNILKKYNGDSNDLIRIVNNNTINSIDNYKKSYDESRCKIEAENIFDNKDDNDIIRICLENIYEGRPTIKELLDNKWFKDPKLKGLRFIENLNVNEMSKNIEFLNNFPNILTSFEDKVLEERILPCFIDSLKYENLVSYLLPPIFAICEEKRTINFESEVWPSITRLLKMKHINAQALYFILNQTKFISERVSNSKFSFLMVKIFCKALDSGVGKILSAVLDNFEYIIKKIDSLDFKTKFFPRLTKILVNSNSLSIKLAILNIFKDFYNLLDQIIINENLLNALETIKKNENKSEICMSVFAVYEEISKVVSLESIANKILPNLIGILVTGSISKDNFDLIMNLIQKYLSRIKEARDKVKSSFYYKDLINGLNNEMLQQSQQSNSMKKVSSQHNDFLNEFFVEKTKDNGKEKDKENIVLIKKDSVNQNVIIKEGENQGINNKITEKIFHFNNSSNKKEDYEDKFNFPLVTEGEKNNEKDLDKVFNKFIFEDNIYFKRPIDQINKDEIFIGHTGFYNFESNEHKFSNTKKEKINNYNTKNGNNIIIPSFDVMGENEKSINNPTFL